MKEEEEEGGKERNLTFESHESLCWQTVKSSKDSSSPNHMLYIFQASFRGRKKAARNHSLRTLRCFCDIILSCLFERRKKRRFCKKFFENAKNLAFCKYRNSAPKYWVPVLSPT